MDIFYPSCIQSANDVLFNIHTIDGKDPKETQGKQAKNTSMPVDEWQLWGLLKHNIFPFGSLAADKPTSVVLCVYKEKQIYNQWVNWGSYV